MKLYIPFRKDNAVLPLNSLSCVYGRVTFDSHSLYLRCLEAFHRRRDAVEYMEKFNEGRKYPLEYKIITFESKEK